MTHSWGQKVIRFYDLDGNLIEVGTPVIQHRVFFRKDDIPVFKKQSVTHEKTLLSNFVVVERSCHMKKFMKEITLFIIQLLIFYLFPLFAKQIDAIGMVLFLITADICIICSNGNHLNYKIKYFYPAL